MEIERFSRYRATLKIRRDPKFGLVKPEIEQFEGKRFETMALWFIDCAEDDSAHKPYDGEYAMETPHGWPVHWVASGDLIDPEPLDKLT